MTPTTFLLIVGSAGLSAGFSAAVMHRIYSREHDEDEAAGTSEASALNPTVRPSESELDEDTMDPRAVAQALVDDAELQEPEIIPFEGEIDDEDAATVLYADVDWEKLADDLF